MIYQQLTKQSFYFTNIFLKASKSLQQKKNHKQYIQQQSRQSPHHQNSPYSEFTFMTIKIRLIKPKIRFSSTFYKSTQIKYQSLSKSPPSLCMRSTQKLIKFKSPWQNISVKQINSIAERLEDKPQDLYRIVKEKQQVLNRKRKFIKLRFNDPNNKQRNLTKEVANQRIIFKSLQKNTFTKRLNTLQNECEEQMKNKLLTKIYEKRKQYEQELKNLFKNKKLIIQTDLPKINHIKTVQNFTPMNIQKDKKLPLWKMR